MYELTGGMNGKATCYEGLVIGEVSHSNQQQHANVPESEKRKRTFLFRFPRDDHSSDPMRAPISIHRNLHSSSIP